MLVSNWEGTGSCAPHVSLNDDVIGSHMDNCQPVNNAVELILLYLYKSCRPI